MINGIKVMVDDGKAVLLKSNYRLSKDGDPTSIARLVHGKPIKSIEVSKADAKMIPQLGLEAKEYTPLDGVLFLYALQVTIKHGSQAWVVTY